MSAPRPSSRLLLAALLAVLLSVPAQAQQRGGPRALPTHVSGTVVDAATGEPIPSATVEVRLSADSSLVTGAITDADGAFDIESLRPGRYYVRVGFVGYAPQIVEDVALSRAAPRADLGTLRLEEDTALLDEVEISAEREYMEVGIDRNVYNVKNQPVTAGGSGRDVLENIPSVEVDVEGNISLRGSQGVVIYLNGKPAPMQGEALTSFLEGLSAEAVERVEVIPNPSARYDPEGMSGIINIVLAQEGAGGWGGSVSAGVDTQGEYNGSLNTHYRQGPWSLYGTYSLRHGVRDFSGTRFREDYLATAFPPLLDQEMEGDGGGLSHTLNATVDYRLGAQTTLSATGLVSLRSRDGGETTRYWNYALPAEARDPARRYDRVTDSDRTDVGMDYRLSFMRTVTPREHELSVEARYEQDREDELEAYREFVFLEARQLRDREEVGQDEFEREASLEVNYRRPVAGLQAEAGYDGEFETEETDLLFQRWDADAARLLPAPDRSDRFEYREQTHALYGILSGEAGPFGAQVGLRAEQALTSFDQLKTGDTFDHDYFSLFPSAHLTYEPFEGNTFKLSYSKRVRRPSTWQLNPLPDYDDPDFRRQGNPRLDPQYTHSMEAGYSRLGQRYTLSLTPYYRRTVDVISWFSEPAQDPDGTRYTLTTFRNFDTEQSYGAEVIASLTLGEWLRASGSFNAYKQVTEGGDQVSQLSSDALGFTTRVSGTFTVRPDLSIQVSQFYRAPMDIPGGRIDAFTMTDVAVQQRLLDGRASLSLRASDLFDTMGFGLERDMEDYYLAFDRDFNRQAVQLTFRYSFGREDRDRRRRGDGGRPDDGGEEGGFGM